MAASKEREGLLTLGLVAAVFYGLAAYAAFANQRALGSASYLVLAPIGMSAMSLFFSDTAQVHHFRRWLFLPWVGTLGAFFVLYALGREDLLCLLILAAPWIGIVTLAAWIIGALSLYKKRKLRDTIASIIIILPFLTGRFEERLWSPEQRVEVSNVVTVDAEPEIVWRNVVDVAPLSESELPRGVWNRLGIPRPLSAKVTGHGAGGTRLGTFEEGLKFVEPIRVFEPNRHLELDVEVDGQSIPNSPSLRHALTGGQFRIERVAYRLEPIALGQTVLRLSCTYAVRSGVNAYANAWVRIVLGDFEKGLLQALKTRAERESTD